MSRLLIFDGMYKSNHTLNKLVSMFDTVVPVDKYIVPASDQSIKILANCIFSVGTNGIFKTEDTVIGAESLDTGGSFAVGTDYYIYICDNSGGNTISSTFNPSEVYKISANSTYPQGYDANNSRKIGGFHYGRIRKTASNRNPINSSGVEYGNGWKTNVVDGIVPNSIYTLKHRPKCNPEGMALVGSIWVDIYLSSDDGANGFRSKYHALPMTGTEGLNWYLANERAARVGKQLLPHSLFVQAALGSPVGENNNDYAYTASSNTGRTYTGSVKNAVSAFNIVDAVGLVWEHNSDLSYRHDTNDAYQGWGWKSVFGENSLYGSIYTYGVYGLVELLSGAVWDTAELAGPRTVSSTHYPWGVSTYIGARGASL